MVLANVAASVRLGRTVRFKARGHSMEPRVRNNEIVTVEPLDGAPRKGTVVLARVNGRWYLHLVKAVRGNQVLIGNNKGGVNGWTTIDNVVGVLKREE